MTNSGSLSPPLRRNIDVVCFVLDHDGKAMMLSTGDGFFAPPTAAVSSTDNFAQAIYGVAGWAINRDSARPAELIGIDRGVALVRCAGLTDQQSYRSIAPVGKSDMERCPPMWVDEYLASKHCLVPVRLQLRTVLNAGPGVPLDLSENGRARNERLPLLVSA